MRKIPEGATHKNAYGFFRKIQDGIWYSYADGDWIGFIDAEPETYIPIQADPEWTGKGLPPVGIMCERSFSCSTWKITTICGHSTDGAYASFYDGDGLMGWSDDCKFRPIQTKEQIAAEKRDAAIKEMQRLVGSCNTFPFAELYDYGYRLQVEK